MGTHRIINVFNVSLSIFVSKIQATERERDKACNNEGRILVKNVHVLFRQNMCFRENDGCLLSIKSRLEFICTKKNVINIEYAYSPRVTIKQKSESKPL